MSKRTKYMNGFTIVMIVLSCSFLIPGTIEGINIGRNVQTYNSSDLVIQPGEYEVYKWNIEDSEKIYGSIYSTLNYSIGEAVVTFAIMRETQFNTWYEQGELKPSIINSTYYYNGAIIDFNNLKFTYSDDYYFVFYNDNSSPIWLCIEVTLIPWGHIIPTGIFAVLLAFCLTGLIIKIGGTSYFIYKEEKKQKRAPLAITNEKKTSDTDVNSEGIFCVSCGAPLSSKESRYCSNCGSSINK